MACKVVDSIDGVNSHLVGKKFPSHAAVARALVDNTDVYVQETNGRNQGWYRAVGCCW